MATKSKSSKRSTKESPSGSELLLLELQEINSAESQLARTLPRFTKAVESAKLRQMVELRLEQGERLIKELETVFDEMEESPGRKKNVAAEGLINDMREHVQEIAPGPGLDAVLIAAIQKTEHYCIAAWGTAKSLAEAIGVKTAVKSMDRALREGKELDERLTQLAEKEITPALLAGEEMEEGEGDEEEEEEEEEEELQAKSRRGSGSERRAPH